MINSLRGDVCVISGRIGLYVAHVHHAAMGGIGVWPRGMRSHCAMVPACVRYVAGRIAAHGLVVVGGVLAPLGATQRFPGSL